MIVKVHFSSRALEDPRLSALLETGGWEPDALAGDGWWCIPVVPERSDQAAVRRLVEPFLTIGVRPLEVKTERIPLHARVRTAAMNVSAHDAARAQQLYALADEIEGA